MYYYNMRIEHDTKYDFCDVLIKPRISNLYSRNQIDLVRNIYFPNSKVSWSGIPIIASNMDTIGTYEVYKVLSKHKMVTAFHKFYNVDDYLNMEDLDSNYFMVSTGINNDDFNKLTDIINKIEVKFICIDVANGYMNNLVKFCRRVRELYPNKVIIAGNVVCGDITNKLINEGSVDIVKVGIGPGSACTTRIKTGVGMPQLSAIDDCSKAAHLHNKFVIADGGITCPGDLGKAFGAGADFVMMGGIFSGHDENPGEIIEEDGNKYKLFYGMSSSKAMMKHYGKINNYRTSEGRVLKVKYKGSLDNTIRDYLGGLRSTGTYIGCDSIEYFKLCCNFVKVNKQYNNMLC